MSDESGAALAAALVAAQSEMPPVERDGKNPHFSSSFTTLDNLLAKVRPVLNRHGIALVQMPSHDENGRPTLITRFVHESGVTMEASMPLMLPKNDPQGQGSALTYAKRYALAAALGISDQADDDGNAGTAAVQEQAPISAKRVKELVELWRQTDIQGDALALEFGAAGANSPEADTKEARAKAFKSLTNEQADKLEAVFKAKVGAEA